MSPPAIELTVVSMEALVFWRTKRNCNTGRNLISNREVRGERREEEQGEEEGEKARREREREGEGMEGRITGGEGRKREQGWEKKGNITSLQIQMYPVTMEVDEVKAPSTYCRVHIKYLFIHVLYLSSFIIITSLSVPPYHHSCCTHALSLYPPNLGAA